MASVGEDPLLLLRQSIASSSAILPTTSAEPSATAAGATLSQATHLQFAQPPVSLPIDAPTRFVSGGKPVDLRSIYFAWLNREVAIPEYNASATKLNDELAAASAAATVHKFAFVERLDLITWLEGASEESEYIKPLAGDKETAAASAAAGAAPSKGAAAPSAAAARSGRGTLDPRLAQIYDGERRMGDHNTGLRGVKPIDFSHVRKLAAPFMVKKPQHPGTSSLSTSTALALNQKAARRPDPIILLSPSASSLLRASNIKSFLDNGRYVPPDSSSTASMVHISRVMKEIDPTRAMRFILVESPEQFKPEYWNRVVGVFTTGQAWQFKHYHWSQPAELFRRVQGIYVGWRGHAPPEAVRGWGSRILVSYIDQWRDPAAVAARGGASTDNTRWRDREVVETIWKSIGDNMRAKGWKRDSAPSVL